MEVSCERLRIYSTVHRASLFTLGAPALYTQLSLVSGASVGGGGGGVKGGEGVNRLSFFIFMIVLPCLTRFKSPFVPASGLGASASSLDLVY